MRRIALVTTTIHVPHLLDAYAQNARHFGHKHVEMIVVGDRKTPAEAAAFCAQLPHDTPCTYLDVPAQEALMQPLRALGAHIPYNCIQRRNLGILLAYARGSDVIITLDDDNFVMGEDFVGLHSQVGSERELPTISCTSGWYNVCATLQCDHDVPIYHRGYPWEERWREGEAFVTTSAARHRCVVNAGFWLDDPDIDALCRMHRQPVVRGRLPTSPRNLALAPGTWSPFNSQNTALWREVIPAYFLSPYVGRYDDIWASYVVLRIAGHLGDTVAFGQPWVRQARNPHDLWRDLEQERLGMVMTQAFCAALRACALTSKDYHAATGELVAQLPTLWSLPPTATTAHHEAKEQFLTGLTLWHEAFDALIDHRIALRGQ